MKESKITCLMKVLEMEIGNAGPSQTLQSSCVPPDKLGKQLLKQHVLLCTTNLLQWLPVVQKKPGN